MPYFLAIDAGGTSTRCLLADDTRILARASTGSIKLQRVSESEATARLTAMLNEVSASADVPLTEITRTCIGLAGLTIPAIRAWAMQTLAATVSGSLLLLGDEEIALDAAFPGTPGILLIAGTGSNCIARAPDGTLHRAGGYGPVLGDEGGGYWIGLEALRATLHALDIQNVCHSERSEEPPYFARSTPEIPGAPSMTASPSWVGSTNSLATPATDLLTVILHHFHLTTLPDLIEVGNRRTEPTPDFASLAPVIARAAAAGNPIAAATLHRAGQLLADLVLTVAAKLGAPSMTASSSWVGSEIPIAFTGSILTEIPSIHESLTATLAQSLAHARLHTTPTDPLLGALHRARKAPLQPRPSPLPEASF